MRSYDPKEGRYKDQSIGDTPKVYTIPVDGKPTRVVGVGCKNGGFYVLRADDGRIVDHTPDLHRPADVSALADAGPADARPAERDRRACRPAARPTAGRSSPTASTPSGSASQETPARADRRRRRRRAGGWWPSASTRRPSAGGTSGPRSPRSAGRRRSPSSPTSATRSASGIAVANGVVYFTTVASGKLVALDAATGAVLKEIDLGPVWSGPSVSRGRVYVGTGNTLFLPPQKDTGVLFSFGLPGEDEVSRLGAGKE